MNVLTFLMSVWNVSSLHIFVNVPTFLPSVWNQDGNFGTSSKFRQSSSQGFVMDPVSYAKPGLSVNLIFYDFPM